MNPYAEADRIRDERNAAILAENTALKAETVGLVGITMTQRQIDHALDLLPERLHGEYQRRRELDGMRVCCGRTF